MEGSTASYEYDDDADASHDLFHPDFATTDDATRADTKEECDEQVDTSISETKYNPNKPKWWKNLSRAPTKGQKKAMNDVLTDHRLPRIPYGTFLDWNEIYPDYKEIWLEIGFGRGENLLALAHRKPRDCLLVGAEIAGTGIGVACGRIRDGLKENKFWKDYELYSAGKDPFVEDSVSQPDDSAPEDDEASDADATKIYDNVRIFPGDGAKLLPYIPSGTLDALLITFPDPFAKNAEEEWRLIQLNTLEEMHRVLKPSTGRLYLATDHDGFHAWSHSMIERYNQKKSSFLLVEPVPSRLEWVPVVSRYEKKGWEEGRSTKLSCWRVP